MDNWDNQQPPFGPPAHWDRDPRPTWADQWWWVPVGLLGVWILSPVWIAAFHAGGWQRALAIAGWACVVVGFINVGRRRRWFRHHAHRQEDRR
jgi:hypothetical protein